MYIDSKYKLDIRDWKEKGRKLNEKVENECKTFIIMHYSDIIMTKKQYDDLAKTRGFITFDDSTAKLFKTNKGFIMEVEVNDN